MKRTNNYQKYKHIYSKTVDVAKERKKIDAIFKPIIRDGELLILDLSENEK